jgi:NTE family protein
VSGVAELPRPIGYVLGGGASLGAIQVGMLQALSEHGAVPDLVAGTSVGSLNGAALALDPTSGANRLSHVWARMTTAQIFPGGLLAQVRTLQQTKTHLFPNTGLAAVIEQFLGSRDRSFEDVVVPFAAVAMDVATERAHPIRHGPLLPALLASAAVPGIYPRVDHDGRRLYDGGMVANVPMRVAVDMGARSLVVLDCAFPSQLPVPGESLAEIMLFTALVAMRTQAVYEAPLVAEEVPVVYLPGPAPRRLISPLDFSHSDELIEASYEVARAFLASLTITGPGLYGSPAA